MQAEKITEEIYQDKVYENTGNPEVLAQVPAGAKRVLDVGCGAGDNARLLKKEGMHVTGVTISESEAELARQVCDKVIVSNIESPAFRLPEKYDAIILSHVCEHLVHPSAALQHLANHLTENGVIIIAIPNMAFYKNRLKLLNGDWTMQESGPFDRTHLHFYSFDTADQLVKDLFRATIKKIPGQLAVPLWPIRKLFPKWGKKADVAVGKMFPNCFAQQTILVMDFKGKDQ